MREYKISNVISKCEDFLEVNPLDYDNVKGILLDPSCSGTGMMDYTMVFIYIYYLFILFSIRIINQKWHQKD